MLRSRPFYMLAGVATMILAASITSNVSAQITAPRTLSADIDPVALLEEQLINRLHATTEVQRSYLRHVVKMVDEKKLSLELVVAIERYALRRNPRYAFPFFERALRFEASRRGVAIASVKHFQSTADVRR